MGGGWREPSLRARAALRSGPSSVYSYPRKHSLFCTGSLELRTKRTRHKKARKATRTIRPFVHSCAFSWPQSGLVAAPPRWEKVHPRFHSGPAARFPAFVSSRFSGKRDAGVPHAGGGVGLRPPSPRSSRCALRYAAGEEHGGERARERVGERARDRCSDYPASAFSLRPSALPRWLAVRRTGFGAVRGAGGSGRAFRFAVMEAC